MDKLFLSTKDIFIIVFCIFIAGSLYGAFRGTLSQDKMPEINNLTSEYVVEKQNKIDEYIRANISTLSPHEPVLGGTFYVTQILWSSEVSGTVFYEDGHIALRAPFQAKFNSNGEFEVVFEAIVSE